MTSHADRIAHMVDGSYHDRYRQRDRLRVVEAHCPICSRELLQGRGYHYYCKAHGRIDYNITRLLCQNRRSALGRIRHFFGAYTKGFER